jgi:hypothetical protein
MHTHTHTHVLLSFYNLCVRRTEEAHRRLAASTEQQALEGGEAEAEAEADALALWAATLS